MTLPGTVSPFDPWSLVTTELTADIRSLEQLPPELLARLHEVMQETVAVTLELWKQERGHIPVKLWQLRLTQTFKAR